MALTCWRKLVRFFSHFFQIIPRIMPALLGDARIKEKFQDQEYLDTVEHMFREKFIENLSVSHKAFSTVAGICWGSAQKLYQIWIHFSSILLHSYLSSSGLTTDCHTCRRPEIEPCLRKQTFAYFASIFKLFGGFVTLCQAKTQFFHENKSQITF